MKKKTTSDDVKKYIEINLSKSKKQLGMHVRSVFTGKDSKGKSRCYTTYYCEICKDTNTVLTQNIKRGSGCETCRKNKKNKLSDTRKTKWTLSRLIESENKKPNLKPIKIEKLGSNSGKSFHKYVYYECILCGNKDKMTIDRFVTGSGCSNKLCNRPKKVVTLDDLNNILKTSPSISQEHLELNKIIEPLETKQWVNPESGETKEVSVRSVEVKCLLHKTTDMILIHNFKNGQGCSLCYAKYKEDSKKEGEEEGFKDAANRLNSVHKNFKLLSYTKDSNSCTIECLDCKSKYNPRFSNALNKEYQCNQCNIQKGHTNTINDIFDKIITLNEQFEGFDIINECLKKIKKGEKYYNPEKGEIAIANKPLIQFKCNVCNKLSIKKARQIMVNNAGCSCGAPKSKCTLYLKNILGRNNIDFVDEYVLKSLSKKGYNLYVDFVIGGNIAIEINGEQHYSMVGFGSKDPSVLKHEYLNRIKNDYLKKEYLISNNYIYIEIPCRNYKTSKWEKDIEKLMELLLEHISKNNLTQSTVNRCLLLVFDEKDFERIDVK